MGRRPLIYNLHDPKYQTEKIECFYCGTIYEEDEKCPNGCEEQDNPDHERP